MADDSGQAGPSDDGRLAAFVTGAGSGIGRATARRLGRDGYVVGAFDLDPDGVQATVDGIVSSGGQAVGFVGDVRDDADHAAAGIRAVEICPRTVESEWITMILADHPDPTSARRAMSERQLDGRLGTPDEVAAGIAFIASRDGRFINGSEFVMDGGMTAR